MYHSRARLLNRVLIASSSHYNSDELENSLGRHQVSVSLDPEEESPIDLIGVYEDMGDIHHKMEAITEEFEITNPHWIDVAAECNKYPLGTSTQMYLKAIELSKRAFSRQTCLNWQRINVRVNCKLARNYQLLSFYDHTLVYLEQAISICERTSHNFLESKLPSLYYCYAHVHLLNNDIENSWLFYNVSHEMASKVDKHLAILSMYELGRILTRVRLESRAQKYFEECLKMALNYLGTVHVLTGMIYEALGIQLRKQNDLTNTMILLEKARDIFKIVLGPEHFFTNRVSKQLSDAVNKRKKSTIYID
ncbi:uncharacterized protein LOC134853929 isoform X2 [Symsagittifera roscoffensis]|uniref:uncharacterized protein LOC134853929 isoform X2 n=1 Tax=Symsagittifera roscoffensis TaxID=84072 RepID=UPI00307CC3C3